MKLVAVTASPLDTAGIAHLSSSCTLRNFFAKIRQPDVGTEVLDQLCFSIKAGILLDHFVGTSDQCVGDVDTERLRCPEIDNKLDLGDLLDGQIGRLLAFEDATGVDAGLLVCLPEIATVTQQPTAHGKFAHRVDRRHCVLKCHSGELLRATIENNVSGEDQSLNLKLNQLCECSIKIAFGADAEDVELQSTRASRLFQTFQIEVCV